MFSLQIPAWDILLRTVGVYLFLLLGLRLAGKREIGQMTVFDLVVLLLLANAVQNAMVGPDNSLLGGMLAGTTLLIINWLIVQIRMRWPGMRRLIDGSPTLLVLHGKTLDRHMLREHIDPQMLESAVREHGLSNLTEVEMAVLEPDGTISIVPMNGHMRTIRKPKSFFRR